MTLHAGKFPVVVHSFIHQSFIQHSLLRKTGEPTGALKIFELACRVPWLRLEAKAKGYNTHFLRVDSTSLNTDGWNPLKLVLWFDVSPFPGLGGIFRFQLLVFGCGLGWLGVMRSTEKPSQMESNFLW